MRKLVSPKTDILRKCEPQVSDWVTFHILYPTAVKPVHREPKSSFLTDDCTEALKILLDLKQKGNYQRQDGIKVLVFCILLEDSIIPSPYFYRCQVQIGKESIISNQLF